MFMQEIFHYCFIRKNLREMHNENKHIKNEEIVVDSENELSDISDIKVTQKVNHDNPYISKNRLRFHN